jgi:TPR repeat protein
VHRTVAVLGCVALSACCGGRTPAQPQPAQSVDAGTSADASADAGAPEWACAADECTFSELEQGCGARVLKACNNLGAAYARGRVVAKDMSRAIALWEDACSSGFARACFNLGGARGIENVDGWFAAMSRGCELGDSLPCSRISEAFAYGQLGPVDNVRATEFLQKACDLDRASSCLALEDAYRVGRGVPADPVRADAIHERACKLAPNDAQCTKR